MMRHTRGEEGGLGKIVIAIILVAVLIFVLYFLTNPAARDFIKNLPTFGHAEDKNVDEVVEDKLIDGVNPCPNKTGYIASPAGGSGAFRSRWQIYTADNVPTNLFFTNIPKDRDDIWLLGTDNFLFFIPREKNENVGIVSDGIFDPSTGIKKRRIIINGIFMAENARDTYSTLPYSDTMKTIQDSYIYYVPTGGIWLCKEK